MPIPKRWRSVRAQKDLNDVTHVTQDHFDFEFVTNTQDSDSPSTPVKSKTTMFNGPSFRSKKTKYDSTRPSSSNGQKYAVDKRLQLTKVEDSWIGIAFGSPTHPPTTMPSFLGTEGTSPSKLASRCEGPLPPVPLSVSKCRKLGNFFKSKSGPMVISAPTQVTKIDGGQTLNMPIATKPWSPLNSPPAWVNAENLEDFTGSSWQAKESAYNNIATTCSEQRRAELPKLEIQIPSVELDRYSVMFSHVSGIKPSSLLERRSKNLCNLNLAPAPPPTTELPPIPVALPVKAPPFSIARRPITPTHQRKPSYSLFPSPPKPQETAEESAERCIPQRQLSFSSRSQTASNSSVSHLESITVKAEEFGATPGRKKHAPSFSSPDETIASSEQDFSPWRSTESLSSVPSSRTSIGSEIYFDLRPDPYSNRKDHSQYIINKPDSPAIELALSESRRARKAKNKKFEDSKMMYNMSPDLQAAEHMLRREEKWRLSLELNQAIEEIEKLTSPLAALLPPLQFNEAVQSFPNPPSHELLPNTRLRKRLDGRAMGFPSPITELSEELSPYLAPRMTSKPHSRRHIALQSIKPAPLKLSNESLSTTAEEFAATPPPVPLKDAKFIPMSRFAASGSSVKLVEHRPKRRKPKRSATETNIVARRSPSSAGAKMAHEKERPATTLSAVRRSTSTRLSPSPHRRGESGMLNVTTQPAAEVSVARTVSLERKQSHQILVSSPISRAVATTAYDDPRPTLSPSRCMSPTFHEGWKAHKPGASFDVVVEGIFR